MIKVKKIEIVVDSVGLPEILRLLDAKEASGYTILRDATGKGERGLRAGDELSDVFKNAYVMTACPPEQVAPIIEAVRPILKKFGGVCLVSDAEWVLH